MAVLDCFDHAFLINIARDVDRMKKARKELDEHRIPFERIEAITASKILRGSSWGNLGCLLTHLSAVRLARRRRYKSIVVIEDDAILRPNFYDYWRDFAPQIKALTYDLFYPYRWTVREEEHRPVRVLKINSTICTHFYAIHSRFYDRYIDLVERQLATPRPKPVDKIFYAKEIKIYAASYNLVGQRAGASSINIFSSRRLTFGR
jgi:hypothetical protein